MRRSVFIALFISVAIMSNVSSQQPGTEAFYFTNDAQSTYNPSCGCWVPCKYICRCYCYGGIGGIGSGIGNMGSEIGGIGSGIGGFGTDIGAPQQTVGMAGEAPVSAEEIFGAIGFPDEDTVTSGYPAGFTDMYSQQTSMYATGGCGGWRCYIPCWCQCWYCCYYGGIGSTQSDIGATQGLPDGWMIGGYPDGDMWPGGYPIGSTDTYSQQMGMYPGGIGTFE